MLKVKKQMQEDMEKLEFDLKHKLEMKDKKITELNQALDNLKLEK